jgi:hypothetical protein
MFLRGARVSSVCVTDQKRPTFAFDLKLSVRKSVAKMPLLGSLLLVL